MQTPALLALHGARGVGKDTTYDFIAEWCAESDPALSAVRRGFADYMKWAYMRQWVPDCTREWAIDFIDQWKNDPDATCIGVSVELMEDQAWAKSQVFIPGVNFRDHMNQFATESAREIYGDDHWLDMLLPKEPSGKNPEGWCGNFLVPPRSEADFPYSFAHFAVITDLRADNEMERVAELGGLKVKIRRKDAEDAQRRYYEERGEDPHLFSRELPDDQFDVVISNNNNSLDDARHKTIFLMNEIKKNGIASIKRGSPLPWRIGY